MSNQVKAWSYSTWGLYKKCPYAFKLRVIDKIKDPSNYAMERGTEIHKKAEYFTKGEIKGMPDELKKFSRDFMMLKESSGEEEPDLAVTKDWQPTTWNDWDHVWCRSKIDYLYQDDDTLVIIDYKTGKPYPSHQEQEHLYATAGFAHYDTKKIRTEMWYLDSGMKSEPQTFNIRSWKGMKSLWEKRAAPLFTDTKFKKCPGDHCKWCNHAKSKGGVCTYG